MSLYFSNCTKPEHFSFLRNKPKVSHNELFLFFRQDYCRRLAWLILSCRETLILFFSKRRSFHPRGLLFFILFSKRHSIFLTHDGYYRLTSLFLSVDKYISYKINFHINSSCISVQETLVHPSLMETV